MFFRRLKKIRIAAICCAVLFLWNSSVHSKESFSRRTPIVVAMEKVGPAVVNIFTTEVRTVQNPFRNSPNSIFERFFKDYIPPSRQSKRRSLGSGVIINPQGYILTNEHVIGKATEIRVTLIDKREYEATLVGADRKSDLAVIKVESKEPLPYVKMGVSHDLMIGETVFTVGNPFGLQHTVTKGIISATNRAIKTRKGVVYHDFIQVDASINPGNSGGPLLNINGSLIGINTAIFQKAEGIGFAIPINHAKRVVNQLIRFGKVRRGWTGVSVQDMTEEMLPHFDLDPSRAGALVTGVIEGSPGHHAGLRRGDIVVSLENHDVRSRMDFQEVLASYSEGNQVRFRVLREGKEYVAKVRISSIPREDVAEITFAWLGLRIGNIDDRAAREYRLSTKKGVVVVEVVPRGPAGRIGIREGDIIRQFNQKPVNSQEDFDTAVIEAGNMDSALLLVQRGRYGYYVTLEK